jgi:DNA-binding MarR family transcriptional regulator
VSTLTIVGLDIAKSSFQIHGVAACGRTTLRKKLRRGKVLDAKLRPHGLRATQFSILTALALRGPMPMGELAERLGLERTTLTRSAALLETRGWIARFRRRSKSKAE